MPFVIIKVNVPVSKYIYIKFDDIAAWSVGGQFIERKI